MAMMALIAAAMLGCALYAHLKLAEHVAGAGKLRLARAVLLVVGVGFGTVSAAANAGDPASAWLAGLIGFGAVHFPAAFILLVKQARGAGRS